MNRTPGFRLISVLTACLALAACGATPVTRDAPPRPVPFDASNAPVEASATTGLTDFRVVAVNVTVPATLQVSESNSYYPGGDIVWHGDAYGNRHSQVAAIVQHGLESGVRPFTGETPVILDVVVTRFHALSPRARYTIGGAHSVNFHLRVRDAKTGDTLIPSYHIETDLEAYGGATAVAAEAHGDSQKKRITTHLVRVIQTELRRPGSFVSDGVGVMARINNF